MSWLLLPATQFAEHASAWDALLRRGTDAPFLESHFLLPLLRHFGGGHELLAMHTCSGALSAATIVRPVGRGMWETFQPSQLPLGPWLTDGDADVAACLRSLMHTLPGLSLGLGATQLDPRFTPRPSESASIGTLDYISTSFVEVEGSFDAYWEARGKNLRQNCKKQRNKLNAEGVTTSIEVVTSEEHVAAAVCDYGILESAGWKAENGTAIHPDNPQGRFYREMLENFCRLGRGRIYRYRFGEQIVAMDMCIDNGPLVVILKTTYDERHRAVSPSTLMRQEEFESWWNEGKYKRIEFYGKTLEWHKRWTNSERTLYHATAYRWAYLRDGSQIAKSICAPMAGWLRSARDSLARRF